LLGKRSLEHLKRGKNLLAFSAGVDSTALFFLLLEEQIEFDMAIVDYGVRESSKDEVDYAIELSKTYNKKLYIRKAPKIERNFEKEARDIRYDFFRDVVKKGGYQNLITAHQLNDRFEWMLMQLSKGAGVVEMLGFEEIQKRDNYQIIRPLLDISKKSLLEYLEKKKIRYFIDSTNRDQKLKRNYFRANFADKFIDEYESGVRRSFEYLKSDVNRIFSERLIFNQNKLFIFERGFDEIEDIRVIDKTLKKVGYLLSKAQRDEILRVKDTVVGGEFSIAIDEKFIYISPFIKTPMPKEFKERCRILKIPPKIRGYIYKDGIDLNLLSNHLFA
jgi:tRNA(Ile)-lysidine synthase